ncbi:hypothetical protein [Thermocoleostomius sinensis]|uniref:Uncharacterized protein n=1 Tax=Thermocoleostomius sinensis A174 TaxID=2016057 RepID=A0A9E8ZNY8_9CYAN|nr:hypothetical protein [Thermocoleostomius sinensis]WAL62081.1 hypothetical protein OXH18_08875 [Thermocoleostomius sinensis A174]
MKVSEQTPHRLKLRHVPFMHWLSGGMLICFCLSSLLYLVSLKPISVSLRCQHNLPSQTSCELRQHTLIGSMYIRKIYDLQSATVIQRSGHKGRQYYYIELFNGIEQIPLLKDADQNSAEHYAIADRINQFIQAGGVAQSILQLYQSGRTNALLSGIFGLVGVGFGTSMTLAPATTCTFYKRLNKVVVRHSRWQGRTQTIERPLNRILVVDIEERRSKYGKRYRPVLVLAAERIPLMQDFAQEQPVRKAIFSIQAFLQQRSS